MEMFLIQDRMSNISPEERISGKFSLEAFSNRIENKSGIIIFINKWILDYILTNSNALQPCL